MFGNDPANNPSYLCSTFFNQLYNSGDPRTFKISRCYYDGLMSATSPDNRVDITQEMIEKGLLSVRATLVPTRGNHGLQVRQRYLCGISRNNPSVTATMAREVEPKLAIIS